MLAHVRPFLRACSQLSASELSAPSANLPVRVATPPAIRRRCPTPPQQTSSVIPILYAPNAVCKEVGTLKSSSRQFPSTGFAPRELKSSLSAISGLLSPSSRRGPSPPSSRLRVRASSSLPSEPAGPVPSKAAKAAAMAPPKTAGTKRKVLSKEDDAAEKRRAAASAAAFADRSKGAPADEKVNPGRVRVLKESGKGKGKGRGEGPVIYWMSRDQRVRDNWALLYAVEQARERGVPVAVAFNLVPSFLGAQARHFGFMLRGLRLVEARLQLLGVPFFLFQGQAAETISSFAARCGASLVVMDFSPLRIGRVWREGLCAAVGVGVAVHEVDAHSTVPVWVASDKLEYSARTLRGKIHSHLSEYLAEYPEMKLGDAKWQGEDPTSPKWDDLIQQVLKVGSEVPEVDWIEPGEEAAMEGLVGPKGGFLSARLKSYESGRNDPSQRGVLSGLSPWLHFGHLSQQRCALEARKRRSGNEKAVDSFLEELVVRSNLSENFCLHQPRYDSVEGAWEWARTTLRLHAKDKREHLYTKEQLEKGKTHDELWNAAQMEMVHVGKMHGFMRMYWAKKILEWTTSPEEALEIAIYLNDKYELDGRDPNGYVGCMWSICGIHDQGWAERPVFGKIRYMNYAGCKRKFNIDGYVARIKRLVTDVKMKQKGLPPARTLASAVLAAGKAGKPGGVKGEVPSTSLLKKEPS